MGEKERPLEETVVDVYDVFVKIFPAVTCGLVKLSQVPDYYCLSGLGVRTRPALDKIRYATP